MKADELREYLKKNLGYSEEEVLELRVADMRDLVKADREN